MVCCVTYGWWCDVVVLADRDRADMQEEVRHSSFS
jgi:hypothetical protein